MDHGKQEINWRTHDICTHAARPKSLCPSKLTKRELEDQYYTVLDQNLELKKRANEQAEKLKILSTKLQRMTATQKAYAPKENKTNTDAAGRKVAEDQNDSLALKDLRKANEELKQQIKKLQAKLSSTQQYLQKNGSRSQFMSRSNASVYYSQTGSAKATKTVTTAAKEKGRGALTTWQNINKNQSSKDNNSGKKMIKEVLNDIYTNGVFKRNKIEQEDDSKALEVKSAKTVHSNDSIDSIEHETKVLFRLKSPSSSSIELTVAEISKEDKANFNIKVLLTQKNVKNVKSVPNNIQNQSANIFQEHLHSQTKITKELTEEINCQDERIIYFVESPLESKVHVNQRVKPNNNNKNPLLISKQKILKNTKEVISGQQKLRKNNTYTKVEVEPLLHKKNNEDVRHKYNKENINPQHQSMKRDLNAQPKNALDSRPNSKQTSYDRHKACIRNSISQCEFNKFPGHKSRKQDLTLQNKLQKKDSNFCPKPSKKESTSHRQLEHRSPKDLNRQNELNVQRITPRPKSSNLEYRPQHKFGKGDSSHQLQIDKKHSVLQNKSGKEKFSPMRKPRKEDVKPKNKPENEEKASQITHGNSTDAIPKKETNLRYKCDKKDLSSRSKLIEKSSPQQRPWKKPTLRHNDKHNLNFQNKATEKEIPKKEPSPRQNIDKKEPHVKTEAKTLSVPQQNTDKESKPRLKLDKENFRTQTDPISKNNLKETSNKESSSYFGHRHKISGPFNRSNKKSVLQQKPIKEPTSLQKLAKEFVALDDKTKVKDTDRNISNKDLSLGQLDNNDISHGKEQSEKPILQQKSLKDSDSRNKLKRYELGPEAKSNVKNTPQYKANNNLNHSFKFDRKTSGPQNKFSKAGPIPRYKLHKEGFGPQKESISKNSSQQKLNKDVNPQSIIDEYSSNQRHEARKGRVSFPNKPSIKHSSFKPKSSVEHVTFKPKFSKEELSLRQKSGKKKETNFQSKLDENDPNHQRKPINKYSIPKQETNKNNLNPTQNPNNGDLLHKIDKEDSSTQHESIIDDGSFHLTRSELSLSKENSSSLNENKESVSTTNKISGDLKENTSTKTLSPQHDLSKENIVVPHYPTKMDLDSCDKLATEDSETRETSKRKNYFSEHTTNKGVSTSPIKTYKKQSVCCKKVEDLSPVYEQSQEEVGHTSKERLSSLDRITNELSSPQCKFSTEYFSSQLQPNIEDLIAQYEASKKIFSKDEIEEISKKIDIYRKELEDYKMGSQSERRQKDNNSDKLSDRNRKPLSSRTTNNYVDQNYDTNLIQIELEIDPNGALPKTENLTKRSSVCPQLCDENKCRTLMDELKQKVSDLHSELSKTHEEYSERIKKLEVEVVSLREDNIRVRGERDFNLQKRESDVQLLKNKLQDVNIQCGELSTKLDVEKSRVAELETRIKAADIGNKVARALEQRLAKSSTFRSPNNYVTAQVQRNTSKESFEDESITSVELGDSPSTKSRLTLSTDSLLHTHIIRAKTKNRKNGSPVDNIIDEKKERVIKIKPTVEEIAINDDTTSKAGDVEYVKVFERNRFKGIVKEKKIIRPTSDQGNNKNEVLEQNDNNLLKTKIHERRRNSVKSEINDDKDIERALFQQQFNDSYHRTRRASSIKPEITGDRNKCEETLDYKTCTTSYEANNRANTVEPIINDNKITSGEKFNKENQDTSYGEKRKDDILYENICQNQCDTSSYDKKRRASSIKPVTIDDKSQKPVEFVEKKFESSYYEKRRISSVKPNIHEVIKVYEESLDRTRKFNGSNNQTVAEISSELEKTIDSQLESSNVEGKGVSSIKSNLNDDQGLFVSSYDEKMKENQLNTTNEKNLLGDTFDCDRNNRIQAEKERVRLIKLALNKGNKTQENKLSENTQYDEIRASSGTPVVIDNKKKTLLTLQDYLNDNKSVSYDNKTNQQCETPTKSDKIYNGGNIEEEEKIIRSLNLQESPPGKPTLEQCVEQPNEITEREDQPWNITPPPITNNSVPPPSEDSGVMDLNQSKIDEQRQEELAKRNQELVERIAVLQAELTKLQAHMAGGPTDKRIEREPLADAKKPSSLHQHQQSSASRLSIENRNQVGKESDEANKRWADYDSTIGTEAPPQPVSRPNTREEKQKKRSSFIKKTKNKVICMCPDDSSDGKHKVDESTKVDELTNRKSEVADQINSYTPVPLKTHFDQQMAEDFSKAVTKPQPTYYSDAQNVDTKDSYENKMANNDVKRSEMADNTKSDLIKHTEMYPKFEVDQMSPRLNQKNTIENKNFPPKLSSDPYTVSERILTTMETSEQVLKERAEYEQQMAERAKACDHHVSEILKLEAEQKRLEKLMQAKQTSYPAQEKTSYMNGPFDASPSSYVRNDQYVEPPRGIPVEQPAYSVELDKFKENPPATEDYRQQIPGPLPVGLSWDTTTKNGTHDLTGSLKRKRLSSLQDRRVSIKTGPDEPVDINRRRRETLQSFDTQTQQKDMTGESVTGAPVDRTSCGPMTTALKEATIPGLPAANQGNTYTMEGQHSRATSPDNTDKEISQYTDLPSEHAPTTQSSLKQQRSLGEDKQTATFTDSSTSPVTTVDTGTLSEGEMPQPLASSTLKDQKVQHAPNENTDGAGADVSSVKMEAALAAIGHELARCRSLLMHSHYSAETSKPQSTEISVNTERECYTPPPISLHKSQAKQQIVDTFAPHVLFTLHIGTVVLSDEAVICSRDLQLMLTWQFHDQNVAMTHMRAGRVMHFDFSTEYDVQLTEEFLDYMKCDEMPIKICEINKPDEPFVSCALPLRDALLHTNRRADLSLALVAGPGLISRRRNLKEAINAGDEVGVLDLWCILRGETNVLPLINKAIAKPSAPWPSSSLADSISTRPSSGGPIMAQLNEDDPDDLRFSADLYMPYHTQNMDSFDTERSIRLKRPNYGYRDSGQSFPVYTPPLTAPHDRVGDGATGEPKRLEQSMGRGGSVSYRGAINTADRAPRQSPPAPLVEVPHSKPYDRQSAQQRRSSVYVASEVSPQVNSNEAMKKAVQNFEAHQQRLNSRTSYNYMGRRLQLRSPGVEGSQPYANVFRPGLPLARASIGPNTSDSIPTRDAEQELNRKYDAMGKMMSAKRAMDVFKQVTIKSGQTQDQFQDRQSSTPGNIQNGDITITVLWLALNEECDAMSDPEVQRLYVAYSFLGYSGAELETPNSLPKPKQYFDKCYFNFEKTFQLSEFDTPLLSRMARCRSSEKSPPNPKECIMFTVVSEPIEDPLGLNNCEDIGNAFLYFGDLLAFSGGSDTYTEVLPVHVADHYDVVCGVLAVKVDGLDVVRKCVLATPQR